MIKKQPYHFPIPCLLYTSREGELIFRLVYEQAGCKMPMKRLWISSMEEQAIKDGFSSLKDGSCYDSHAAASAHGHKTWECYLADDNGSQEVEVTRTRDVAVSYTHLDVYKRQR